MKAYSFEYAFFLLFHYFNYYKIEIKMKNIIVILLTYLSLSSAVLAQSAPDTIYAAIERGITNSKVENFTHYIKNKAYISLMNNASAYFSQSQVHYVLQEFLDVYEPVKLANFAINH